MIDEYGRAVPNFQSYDEAQAYQLAEWLAGRPWHNPLSPCGDEGGECCPDFSCCNPDMLAPKVAREKFVRSCPEERWKLLSMFLSGLTQKISDEIHFVDILFENETKH